MSRFVPHGALGMGTAPMGNLITETLPALNKELGQDGYTLVASDTLRSGKTATELVKESQMLFGQITVKYKGTPWAIQAKQEKSVVIGLNWKPASRSMKKD